jgi:type I restriction enzyme S subunit
MSGKYQAYPVYKDSGVEWLGRVPQHWRATQTKYGYTIVLGKMLQTVPKTDMDLLKPYLRAANIQPHGLDLDDVKKMWFSPNERLSLRLEAGDVLISEGGDVGRSAIWQSEIPECYIQNAVNRARSHKSNVPNFLNYWLKMIKASGFIDIICNKSTIPHYTAEKVEATPILLPPPEEQRTIAAFLDHETARSDRLIEKQQRLIELLKEKRQAVISHAVTKGLDPNVPMKDSGVEWLGQVPEHWCVTSIRNLVRSGNLEVQDGNHGELHPVANEYVDVGIPFLMANNIRDGKIDTNRCKRITKERADQLRIGFSVAGDMLLTHKGTVGEVAKVPEQIDEPYWMLTPQVTYYRWSPRFYDSSYFTYQFQSKAIATQLDIISAMQSTRSYVGLIAQGALIVTVPPIREQMQIQKELFRRTNKFNGLLSKASLMVKFLQERRTALISAAVTGKIDVRNWQPNTSTQVAESDLPMAAEQAAEAAPAHPCAHGTGSSMNSVTR